MTEQDWLKLIDIDPDNTELRLVFADWLEDTDQIVKAEGVRYQITKKKKPHYAGSGRESGERDTDNTWDWWAGEIPPQTQLSLRHLPCEIFDCLEGGWLSSIGAYREYTTRIEAEQALWQAYVKAKKESHVSS